MKKKATEIKEDFFNKTIIQDFRETYNSSPIFSQSPKYQSTYNVACVFMDRIDSSIHYLNAHTNKPETEDEFIDFLVRACILRDGINQMFDLFSDLEQPFKLEKKFFSNVAIYGTPFFSRENCPTDDEFFEYLRAMAFAHPYEVRKKGRSFIEEGEQHYCPWVVVPGITSVFCDFKDAVGIRIYSNKTNDIKDLTFSFNSLKQYLRKRYESIQKLTEYAINCIETQNSEWKKVKINRNKYPIEILKEIKKVLAGRYIEEYGIEIALADLELPLSCLDNTASVEEYRRAIINLIPGICDAVDELDNERVSEILDKVIYCRPEHTHKMCHYQLEKIFDYLDVRSEVIIPESNEEWGLQQVYDFSQEFAKKWVVIDVVNMPYDEIKLLVRTACYLEAMEQEKE